VPFAVETRQFLRDNFRSVWSLELLLHIARESDRSFTSGDLVGILRASPAIVDQGLVGLVAAGLVVTEDDGRVRYAPANPELHALVEGVKDEYALRPDAVRRVIVAGAASGASAFADAFRLRKD
jgi:hypothetical protein